MIVLARTIHADIAAKAVAYLTNKFIYPESTDFCVSQDGKCYCICYKRFVEVYKMAAEAYIAGCESCQIFSATDIHGYDRQLTAKELHLSDDFHS